MFLELLKTIHVGTQFKKPKINLINAVFHLIEIDLQSILIVFLRWFFKVSLSQISSLIHTYFSLKKSQPYILTLDLRAKTTICSQNCKSVPTFYACSSFQQCVCLQAICSSHL